ncbi:MAG: glycoside hydrolase family 20 zincin-like fold domain-containing protein [Acidimicrobiales bacterium]
MTDSILFPRPRHIEWGDGFVAADTAISEEVDPTLPAEGYRLTVDDGGIELRHADDNGRRYGHQTLGQLTEEAGVRRAHVVDHPDVAVRGHMLDISRDRVPTRDTLELLVRRLAACRYNHLQLYTEHTFAYRDHPTVWADASPMTADDMVWLDELCAQHGIELAANQNTFGHMERWLRHDAYRHRAEAPDGFARRGSTIPPGSLAPTAANAAFAVDLVRELMDTVTSRRVNVGCDEVFELGQGVSADDVAARGKTEVFVEHLRRIVEPLLADGFEVQFWADMLESNIEIGQDLAQAGAIATIWGYEAPLDIDPDTVDLSSLPDDIREMAEEYLRNAAQGFGPRMEAFSASGFRRWVAPGTSGWNSFVGRHHNARANILDAVEAAIASDAEGMLNTEWGDNGHMQPPFATFPALAYGGAASWCRAANGDLTDDDLAQAISRRIYNDHGGTLARAQIELGLVGATLGLPLLNGCPFFYCWITSGFFADIEQPSAEALAAAIDQVRGAADLLASAAPRTVDGDQLVAETQHSAELVAHGLRRLAARFDMDGAPTDQLAAEVTALKDQHRRHWLARSRPGGLDDSVARMSAP